MSCVEKAPRDSRNHVTVEMASGVALIVALASFGHTVAGFGFSLLAVAPLGLVIDPKDAVVVASILLLTNCFLLAWSERANVDWSAARLLLMGALPGLPLGLLVLEVASVRALRMILAIAVVASVAILAAGARLSRPSRRVELSAGFVTGLLTTSINANGPPTALALQARGSTPEVFRPTTSAVLGISSGAGALLFAAAGRMQPNVGEAVAVSVPGLLVGWFIGRRVCHRIPDKSFQRLVMGLLLLAAAVTAVAAFTS